MGGSGRTASLLVVLPCCLAAAGLLHVLETHTHNNPRGCECIQLEAVQAALSGGGCGGWQEFRALGTDRVVVVGASRSLVIEVFPQRAPGLAVVFLVLACLCCRPLLCGLRLLPCSRQTQHPSSTQLSRAKQITMGWASCLVPSSSLTLPTLLSTLPTLLLLGGTDYEPTTLHLA